MQVSGMSVGKQRDGSRKGKQVKKERGRRCRVGSRSEGGLGGVMRRCTQAIKVLWGLGRWILRVLDLSSPPLFPRFFFVFLHELEVFDILGRL